MTVRKSKVITDTEWAALPLEIRMWCMDQARQTAAGVSDIETNARLFALILTRRPVANPIDEDVDMFPPQTWKQQRGLE